MTINPKMLSGRLTIRCGGCPAVLGCDISEPGADPTGECPNCGTKFVLRAIYTPNGIGLPSFRCEAVA